MSDEQHMILQMVAEGKITADEGARLLEAIKPKADSSFSKERMDEWGERISSFFSGDASDWIRNLGSIFGPKATFSEEEDQTLEAEGISVIQAGTTNGRIVTTGTDTSQIRIQVRKVVRAPREEDARAFSKHVEISVDKVDSAIQIREKHPVPPPGITVTTDLTIQCPAGVDLKLRSTNGQVKVSHTEGATDLITTNGMIQLESLTGPVTARSTNGSVQASSHTLRERLDFQTTNGAIKTVVDSGDAPIRLATTNGSITLTLPDDFSGMLDANTSNGVIHSELPVAVSHQSKRHLAGRLGTESETPIDIETKNGGIRLKRLFVEQP